MISKVLIAAVGIVVTITAHAQPKIPLEPLPMDNLQSLAQVYGILRKQGIGDVDGQILVSAAIRGMVHEVDPDGAYFDSKDMANFRQGSASETLASGLQLRRDGGAFVLTAFAGGSAAEAGVESHDVLYAIDGKKVSALGQSQVTDFINSGSPDSSFELTVFRESDLSLRKINVRRTPWTRAAVTLTSAGSGVVVLKIPQFTTQALQQTARSLTESWGREHYRGVVLDLRGCPGGLVDVALAISSIFLPSNLTVVSVDGRVPETKFIYRSSPEYYHRGFEPNPVATIPAEARGVPVSVLVDHGTASGAEIVAAALQDHRRAKVVGEQTWGRGSIQTVVPLLHNDGLKYTTAYWYTPNRRKIEGVGVTPDVLVAPRSGEAVQAAVAAALQ